MKGKLPVAEMRILEQQKMRAEQMKKKEKQITTLTIKQKNELDRILNPILSTKITSVKAQISMMRCVFNTYVKEFGIPYHAVKVVLRGNKVFTKWASKNFMEINKCFIADGTWDKE